MVYFVERGVRHRTTLDPASLESSSHYARDATQVFFRQTRIDADPATFEALTPPWGQDAERLFHEGVAAAEKQPKNIRILSPIHAVTAFNALWKTRIVPLARVSTFRPLHGDFSTDGRQVYDGVNRFDADAATFRTLDPTWAVDARAVYRFGQKQPFDPNDFDVRGPYLLHSGGVWFGDMKCERAHPGSFASLGGDFGRDHERVYFRGLEVDGATAEHFTVVRGALGQDQANGRFFLGHEPWAGPTPTFFDFTEPMHVLRLRADALNGDASAMAALAAHFGTEFNRTLRSYRTGEDEWFWLLAAATFGHAESQRHAAESTGLSAAAQRRMRERLATMLRTGEGLPRDEALAARVEAGANRARRSGHGS